MAGAPLQRALGAADDLGPFRSGLRPGHRAEGASVALVDGLRGLCNHLVLAVCFYFFALKDFFVFQSTVCYIKGGRNSEVVYLGLIFLHLKNLAL